MEGRRMRCNMVITVLWLAVITPGAIAAEEMGPGSPLPVEALHLVEPGDYLYLLAGYYYDDPRQWERIYRTNRDRIKKPSLLEKGLILRIPLPPNWERKEPYQAWKARIGEEVPLAKITPSKAPE
ncbi:MAG: hypothetical protein ACE5HK_06315 [Candidatus Methylomirabilales bacterium]